MNSYLLWSGIALNAVLIFIIAAVFYAWFILPLVEACSLTRMYMRFSKLNQKKAKLIPVFYHWYRQTIFIRTFDRVSGNGWQWSGIGKWSVQIVTAA